MTIFSHIRWKFLLAVFKLKRMVRRWYGTRDLDYPRTRLTIVTGNLREYHTRARSVAKEPDTVAWIERIASPEAVFYDIGANIGAYSLIAASLGARVVAFEPMPENLRSLHENVGINALEGRITAAPFVVGARAGIISFQVPDQSSGASWGFREGSASPHGQVFLTLSLDSSIPLFGFALPTALKVDVDGGEIEVLQGAVVTLRSPTLSSVMVEADDVQRADVERLMVEAGFKLEAETRMDVHTVNCFFKKI